jgi:uncharacterized membrane protein (GlpM family)
MQFLLNVGISACLISFVVWLSKTNPLLSGFIVSLPLTTLITLAISNSQSQDSQNTLLLAKSIFVGVPSTLLFFVPFLLANRLKLSFWTSYATGLALLACSFGIHRFITSEWLK